MKTAALTICAVFALLLACDDSPTIDDDGNTSQGIKVNLTADRDPSFMETVTLTCQYEVKYPILPVGRDDYIVTGHFVLPSTHFTVLSGDSSWVDTVGVNIQRQHSVTVRAIMRGNWLVDVLATSVIEDSVSTIGGGDSIELSVD